MTDFDWYNYLKANFKPDQGSAYFFYLADCHKLEDLKPLLIHSQAKLEDCIHEAAQKDCKFAYIEYHIMILSFCSQKKSLKKKKI